MRIGSHALGVAAGTMLCIAPEGRLLVRIWPDGRLEYGPEYEPDEAARIFWEAIARWAPAPRPGPVT